MKRRKFIKKSATYAAVTVAMQSISSLLVAQETQTEQSVELQYLDYNNGFIFNCDLDKDVLTGFDSLPKSARKLLIVVTSKDETSETILGKFEFQIRNVKVIEEVQYGTRYYVEFGKTKEEDVIREKASELLRGVNQAVVYLSQSTYTTLELKDAYSQVVVKLSDPRADYSDTYVPGCFLTTACVEVMGKPDNGYALERLRALRDGYMQKSLNHRALIKEYYAIGPSLCKAINKQPAAEEIYKSIYHSLVLPSLAYIEQNNEEEAVAYYAEYVNQLNHLLLKHPT